MKVALVYDRVNKWGGAERVLLALHEIWPEAPLYTAVYDPARAAWAHVFKIKTSFLQHFPLAKSTHELYPWLTPLAFETFNFDDFEVVISVTSAEAKNIITKPQTLHICYCLTPTRYLWSGYEQYLDQPGFGSLGKVAQATLKLFAPTLRRWDLVAAGRPDHYIAISQRVRERVERYYHRQVEEVISPPVEVERFKPEALSGKPQDGDYYLTVSRLVGYKRVDLIVDAFNALGWPLVIIGQGREKGRLKRRASRNVKFIDGYLTDSELVRYYQSCRALVYAADEDFGLVAVEAQACGKPVIAFGHSGVAEVIKDRETGVLFCEQTPESLVAALRKAQTITFDTTLCLKNAQRFAKVVFQKAMKASVERLYRKTLL